ncbi:sugar phosphate isomerase/epimerase family protein [Ruania zhangjianzhongii]|uniref:sugar phosphate isomerase/epimerase family protein n=1 Tax=Ruania zhangjianzhongii TaxID=2603206 RepID=UPI0011C81E1F|nr:sugar phosphate isomerase/epimerase [Ruania zhangjianzhongii]
MTGAEISVQLYSVREAIADDLPAAIARIAQLGFTHVEPWGFVDKVDQFREALTQNNLTAPSAHARLVTAEEVQPTFAAAAALGVRTLIDPMVPAERWTTREDVQATADRLAELAGPAAEHGLTIGYHNHSWELAEQVEGRPALEVFADLLDERVVLEVDTYWAAVGGVPAPELLARLGERVKFLHVKDGPITDDPKAQLPAGTGAMDVPAVLAAAPDALRVIEFDAYAGDIFEGLAASLAYLRGLA